VTWRAVALAKTGSNPLAPTKSQNTRKLFRSWSAMVGHDPAFSGQNPYADLMLRERAENRFELMAGSVAGRPSRLSAFALRASVDSLRLLRMRRLGARRVHPREHCADSSPKRARTGLICAPSCAEKAGFQSPEVSGKCHAIRRAVNTSDAYSGR
jgi:hypothetical protein